MSLESFRGCTILAANGHLAVLWNGATQVWLVSTDDGINEIDTRSFMHTMTPADAEVYGQDWIAEVTD